MYAYVCVHIIAINILFLFIIAPTLVLPSLSCDSKVHKQPQFPSRSTQTTGRVKDTDRYNRFLIESIALCLAQYSLILCGIDYQSIGWCHYNVPFRMRLLYLPVSIGDTRCSIASFRFCQYIIYWHIRDLLLDNANVFLVCHYPHVFDRTDWFQSIYCQLNKGTTDTHHINEQLWVIGG